MTTYETSPLADEQVVSRAADLGFRLLQYETDNGQLAWEWQRGNEPRPQFVTRRVAIHWMAEFLALDHRVPFVAMAGRLQWDEPRRATHGAIEPM
ncbi:MAG TPA: hypothetical protein VGN51_09950 [Acidimicrobiia bacterium]|jgi:hypothetical protein